MKKSSKVVEKEKKGKIKKGMGNIRTRKRWIVVKREKRGINKGKA